MFYGANIWDPALIISQIVALQCMCYLSLGVLQWVIISPYHHSHLTLHFLFDWRYINVHSFTGWLSVITCILNSFLCSAYLMVLVGRAKKCLDFASTLYIWHAIFTMWVSGLPRSVVWWVVFITNMAITSLLGEWVCLQFEMREIPLSNMPNRSKRTTTAVPAPRSTTVSRMTPSSLSGASNTTPTGSRVPSGGLAIAMTARAGSSNLTQTRATARETTRLLGPNAV
mmetsp:Transcript_36001/g.101958  ORF Transcript_36001/g.101958 Transcript_36001/m.101958 type:complete len:227 (-) Transcript_36001:132-812(-)